MGEVKTVLIVEDDEEVRGALAALLSQQGYAVTEAADGQEALVCLRAGIAVCIIVLDLVMPRMNGWEFRAEQLKDPALDQIPVIVMTADPAAAKRAASLQAVATLTKPLEIDRFLEVIGAHC